jgi:hypothetical protein
MATIAFDTLKFVEKLKAAGIPEDHAKAEAEALVSAFSEAMDSQLSTKTDINRIEQRLTVIDGELKLNRWMLGIIIVAEVGPLLAKLFQ